MRHSRRSKTVCLLVMGMLSVCSIAGCPAPVAAVGFTIAARTFVFALETAGRIAAQANASSPTRTGGVVTLPFDSQPVDQPASARLNLDIGTTRALPIDSTAKGLSEQSITGSATLTVRIASGSSTNPCDDGVEVGAFNLTFSNSVVSAAQTSLSIPSAALGFVRSGTFTICLKLTTTVDVLLVVEQMGVEFGPAAPTGSDNDPNEIHGSPNDGTPNDGTPNDGTPNDGTPNDGTPSDSDDDPTGGFTPAIILHRGTEQIVAGPKIDPSCGYVYSDDYTVTHYVFDQYNDAVAVSGSGNRVWFRLEAPYSIPGQPRVQLWSINPDGTGAERSLLPANNLDSGLHVRSSEDGSVCIANNPSGKVYRAEVGKTATAVLDYSTGTYYDMRYGFAIDSDATRLFLINRADATLYTMSLTAGPFSPSVLLAPANLPVQTVLPRAMTLEELDVAGDASRFVIRANYDSSLLTPRTQDVFFYGSDLSAATVTNIEQRPYNDTVYDLNISDDGQTIAYCYQSDGIDSPNVCVVESYDGSSRTTVGDGRTRVGDLFLADKGERVYYRTKMCCSGGDGIFETIGTGEKIPAGTQVFSDGPSTGRTNISLSDDGYTLATSCSRGVYVLRDGFGGGGAFPLIESIGYRYETAGEDCSLIVRVTVNAPNGIERIFVNPYIDGVDPTLVVPGEENPFYAIRGGGGVNWSTTFDLVEGTSNVYEKVIPLTNSVNQCAADFLIEGFRLRIIVIDGTQCRTVFADFDPTM